jgi:hypothetical protein
MRLGIKNYKNSPPPSKNAKAGFSFSAETKVLITYSI